MASFHINPNTGEPGKCSAEAGNCPFGGEHFDTREEARSFYEAEKPAVPQPLQADKEMSPSLKEATFEILEQRLGDAPATATATATAQQERKVSKETLSKAQTFAERITALRTESPEFFEEVEAIDSIGSAEKLQVHRLTEGLMQRSLASSISNNSPQDKIAMDLSTLRTLVEDLDPNNKPTGFLGALRSAFPGGNKMKAYFRKFESAGEQLQAVVEALDSGKDGLIRDNIAIKQERDALWKSILSLEETDKELSEMTAELNSRISAIEATDPETAELYRNEVLVPVQRKQQDILTEIAVAKQGYQALDIIRKNNVFLMQTVERTNSTTVAALRTAVVQSQALDSQKRVIDQVQGVQNMTSQLLERSSADLRSQSAEINQSMNDPVVATESIKKSFANLYATMDEAAATKAKASEAMAKTIAALKEETARAEEYMVRGE